MPALLSSLFARPLNKAAPESKSRATYERHSSVQAWRAGSHSRAAVTAQMQSTEVRRATQQVNVPVQGLPIQQREKLQPESPREHALSSPSDITASNRAYSVLVKDRGGSIPTDIPTTQQRLQEILTVDRQDTPAPGSQVREGHQVVATVIFPQDEPPMLLPQAVEALFAQHFSSLTASKKAVRRKELLVDGKVCNTTRVVSPGERMEWIQRVSTNKRLDQTQSPTKLQVVFEDEHMACIVKPQGMPTAQSGDAGKEDVRQCLPYSLKLSEVPGLLCRPQHVHRLDEATGGLLVVAKSRQGLKGLSAAFEHRQVQKTYRTLVGGRLEGQGYVDIPLDGKPSLTEYRSVSQTESGNHGWISTLDLLPHTGRMHQLRRHMALLGHPVLGDPRYTYGYANRHPDAPIRLTPVQSQQAMTKPFGVASDHPYYTPDPAAKLTYAFWASQRLGLATKSVSGAVPGASSEPSFCEASNVDAQAAASEVRQVDATSAVSSMQANAADAVEAELAQDSLRLHRPNRMAKPQQSLQTSVQASGLDPTMTDLSLQAQSRLEASAPHYSGAVAQQQQGVSVQMHDQPLPAALQRMLCLWAVRLMMPHPLTHAKMQFSIPDPPLFHQMRDAEAQLAWKLRQESSQ